MCCACGGGSGRGSGSGTCRDTANGKKDQFGEGCDYYKTFKSLCGFFDDDDFKSKQMCCACGGGNKG